jgi:hypothetical protein
MPEGSFKLDLETWRKFAALAYAGFQGYGRGAIINDVLQLVSPAPGAAPADKYLTLDKLKEQDWIEPDCLAAVEAYPPDTSIVIISRKLDGGLRVDTLSTTEGPSPKEAYEQWLKAEGLKLSLIASKIAVSTEEFKP